MGLIDLTDVVCPTHSKGGEKDEQETFALKSSTLNSDSSGYGLTCSRLSAILVSVLDRIPSLSWGLLGFKYPALTSLVSFAVLPVVTIWGLTSATALILVWIAFPFNLLGVFGVLSPLVLIALAEQWKRFKAEWTLRTRSHRRNPNAIDEYMATIENKET